jgi:UDP-galactopyranose mutase
VRKRVAIVGAGFYGLVFAEQLSQFENVDIHIFEKRSHIGGNAWSYINEETGIEVHKYGSHLFHTSNKVVWEYMNRFTRFTNYIHNVWVNLDGKIYPLPINLATISLFLGKQTSPQEASDWISLNRNMEENSPDSFEKKAIESIGRPLYESFIKGYTWKQWQTDPRFLPSDIISRLPVRNNFDNRYFNDTYEGLPENGYFKLFEKIMESIRAKVHLNCDFLENETVKHYDLVVYTGPLDKYFGYRFGLLGWRTLDFELETHHIDSYQGTPVINFANLEIPFTRIHEFKHLHPERKHQSKTITAKEYSRFAESGDEPYYPINSVADREILAKYRELAKREANVIFGGRLGSYKYLDMHMAIASALSDFRNRANDLLGLGF